MEVDHRRVYEPWQEGLDITINHVINGDVRKKIGIVRNNIKSIGEDALVLARHLNYRRSEENDRLAVEWLRYGSKAYAAYFELAREPKKKQTIRILDLPPVTWDGRGIIDDGMISALDWQEAYFLAAVMRDRESMDSLARFPVDLLRKSATKNESPEYLLVEAIQSLHLGRPDYETRMTGFTRTFDMRSASDWIMYITMGKFETLVALTQILDLDFNAILAKHLGSHRRYYERHTPENIAPVDSWIAIALLGMACMAHDKGEPVTVESDYIPRFLIEGTYLF
ncbi:hypothetical protein Dvar_73420 [Desulfosarcina variabilis str. Montpellier]|uniref:immunity 49 family protein n=1 Tax=Desulfosarcina variabilis TaxID=2300 RepID=UPI003AFA660E